MTKEDIIRMARQAGSLIEAAQEKDLLWLERFSALIASAEREACIKIVENEAFQYASPVWAFEIVNDIKARGNVATNDTSQKHVDKTSENVQKPCGLECDCTDVCKQVDYKALWQQMCERCDELDKRLAQLEYKSTSDHQFMENVQGELERIKLVQTGVGIEQRAEEAYETAKQRSWVGVSDEVAQPEQEEWPEEPVGHMAGGVRPSQPEQAPMNYYIADAEGNLERTDIHFAQPKQDWIERERAVGYREGHMAALSQRKWVELSNAEVKKIVGSDRYTDLLEEVVKIVEAKLKEKNT